VTVGQPVTLVVLVTDSVGSTISFDWGDGTTDSFQVQASQPGGSITLQDSHVYTSPIPGGVFVNVSGVDTNKNIALIAFDVFVNPASQQVPGGAPAAPSGNQLAGPSAVFTFLVRQGKHWDLLVWNSDPAKPFLGSLLLEGLSQKQAKELHLPSASTPLLLYLQPGGIEQLALPFTPSSSLTGVAL
jgi:hypothetical protein